jgi:hypothetical protein
VLTMSATTVIVVMLLWPRGYTFQGRTVGAWFKDCAKDQWVRDFPSTGEIGASGEVFRLMGTNVVPFLASRITRDLTPSRLDRWMSRLPRRFRPATKEDEAYAAAHLIRQCVKPPESMLRELLKPAMSSTNGAQINALEVAFGEPWDSWRPRRPLHPPPSSTGTSATAFVTVLQPGCSKTVQTTNREHIKMIQAWLQEVKPTQLPPEKIGAVGPWCTVTLYAGSNAISTNLVFAFDGRTTRRELLTDEQRQKLLNIIGQK